MSPASFARKWIVLGGLILSCPALTIGQTSLSPIGGETAVTEPLAGDQVRPAIALGAAGGLVVWHGGGIDPFGNGIGARRLDASMSPTGDRFRVNATLIGDQENAAAAMFSDGGAVVVWEGGKVGFHSIFARFLDASGAFTTSRDISVNTPSVSKRTNQRVRIPYYRNNRISMRSQLVPLTVRNKVDFSANPVVTVLSDGTAVVAYGSFRTLATNTLAIGERLTESLRRPGVILTNTYRQAYAIEVAAMQDVYVQRFSARGEKIGGEFVANSTRESNQRNVSAAALAGGSYVLCWVSEKPVNDFRTTNSAPRILGARVDVYARVFAADGTPLTDELKVNSDSAPCGAPVVAPVATGGFAVAWVQRDAVKQNGLDIFTRTFGADFQPATNVERVNTTTYGDQFAPTIATAGSRQVLVWTSMGQDGSWEGIYGRTLSNGVLGDSEFRVNTTTQLGQKSPSVSANGSNVSVVWSGYAFDTGFDLFMQRYQAQ